MRYRAVVFDLDGTLLDTLEDLANAMNAVLSRHGLVTHDLTAYKRMVGDGVRMLVTRALPDSLRREETITAVETKMRAEYARRQLEHTRPYPGIPELLNALASKHIPMAILSNKPHEATRAVVAALLSAWQFDVVQGETPETPRKPDPVGALSIASRLGIPPEEFLYVGDTDTDMKTANRAGMLAVGALWGFRDREELLAHGARTLIEAPLQLLECFDHPPSPA